MSRKMIALLAFLFIAPVIVYLLWPSDEARIRKLFREGAAAVGEEKMDDVMAKVSFNYADAYGLTYLFIREGMERLFRQYDKILVDYEISAITVQETGATAKLEVRVLASRGEETGYIAGDLPNPLRMTFRLEKERGKWLVSSIEGLPFRF